MGVFVLKTVSKVEELIYRYERNPVIRGLVQLIPLGIGSGMDVAVLTTVQNIRADRLRTFFDELSENAVELTPELLQSEDFLHSYFATIKAATNSRNREKIKMFARLLKSASTTDLLANTDEFEEYLNILEDMSYREISVLFKLYLLETSTPMTDEEGDYKRAEKFWDQFVNDLDSELGIGKSEVLDTLQRLERTGCYEKINAFWGNDKGVGHLTPSFYRLKEIIMAKDDSVR